LAFVFACSSSGTEDTPMGEFLSVLQTAPQDGTDQAQTEARVGFQIDRDIDPSSLTSETFFVTDEDGMRVEGERIVLDDDPTAAEIVLSAPLSVITNYTATITTGLRARSGETLEEDFEWTFKTLDSEWGISEWIEEDPDSTSADPLIAVDAENNAVALWQRTTADGTAIWSNRYTRRDLWGEPQQIDGDSTGASDPALALDDAGNTFALWVRREGGSANTTIWSNRYDAELGVWDTAELLQSGEITRADDPAVAAAPGGDALAVWIQVDTDSPNQLIWSRTYTSGSGWGDAGPIGEESPAAVLAGNVAVDMDDDGNGVAVWTRPTVDGDVVWANRYVSGSGWGEPQLIKTDVESEARGIRLSVGAGGDAFVVWSQTDDAREDVWAVRFSGTEWAAPERVDTFDAGDKRTPDIAVDGAGVAHAVWAQVEDPFINIWGSQYDVGSGWAEPILIEPPNEDPNEDGDATLPRVATNSAGNAFVVWLQTDDNWSSVWSNRLDPETGWFTAELIEDIDRPARPPVIAVDNERHAHALWPHFVSSGFDWCRTNRFE
jgi:hypothetical protein